MPDEIVGGDTAEGTVPAESGDAAGSTDNAPETSSDAGTASASAPFEIPEAYRDQFVPVERYQNLESKLGNWQETERLAALAQQLQADPRVLSALQPQATPEQIPDFSAPEFSDPKKVIDWLDQRSEQRAQKLFDQKMEEFKRNNIDPMANDVYGRQANDMIQSMEAKYADFKDHKDDIAQFLDQNPGIAENLNEKTLEMAYRYVTYEKQQQAGAKEAVKKLQTKAKDTSVKPSGSAPAAKAKPKTIAEAWAQAEEAQNG